MLQHHFYTVDSLMADNSVESANSGHVTVSLNGDHEVFAGHFPGRPVVPGVFTLQIIKECLELIEGKGLQYRAIHDCKFTHVILPENGPVSIELSYLDYDSEEFELKAKVKQGGVVCLSLNTILIDPLRLK